MEENIINIPLEVIDKRVLLFEPFKNDMHLNSSELLEEDTRANLSFNFDYEQKGTSRFLFHFDIGFCIPSWANILVRTTIRIKHKGKMKDWFIPYIITPMVKGSFDTCIGAFKQRCGEFGIAYPHEIKIADESINSFAHNMIENYLLYRSSDDEANKKLLKQEFLSFTPGTVTQLLVMGTLIITEQVLWLNPGFSRIHNRSVFPIPMPVYNTMKLKCLEVMEKRITFNLFHSTYFLLCMDCALCLLLGDHAPLLTTALEAEDFSIDKQEEYIKEATKFFASVKESMEKSKATISNLENRPDWNKLIQ